MNVAVAARVQAALDAAGIRRIPIIGTADGVEVYVPRSYGAAGLTAVGDAIAGAGLHAHPMAAAHAWRVQPGDAP